MLTTTHHLLKEKKGTISTKHAAIFLTISYAAFMKEIDLENNQGTIRYQARIDDSDNSRPILGFEIPYLKEVKKVLGTERQRGRQIFTSEVRKKIDVINYKWAQKLQ